MGIYVYVHRYGYIPSHSAVSITEMEYDWEKEAELPIRVFVVDEKYDWAENLKDEHQAKLTAFKNQVGSEKVWKKFTSPASLARVVNESLVHDKDKLSREQQRQQPKLTCSMFSKLRPKSLILSELLALITP